jgi:molybdopterin synthase catalytic subunit
VSTLSAGAASPPTEGELGRRVRLVSLRSTDLSVDEVLAAVQDPAAGGHAVFIGTVRDHDGGRDVLDLSYSAHTSAPLTMRQVALRIAATEGVCAVAAVHRVGDLRVGDLAVVVAVSAAHREDAFAACRRLIDDIKAEVPIWKHQAFADGGTEWVGSGDVGEDPVGEDPVGGS